MVKFVGEQPLTAHTSLLWRLVGFVWKERISFPPASEKLRVTEADERAVGLPSQVRTQEGRGPLALGLPSS